MSEYIVEVKNTAIVDKNELDLIAKYCGYIREDIRDNPYIEETLRVLPVGGFRSAIGSFWNAVVDDLRQKIIYRSLPLFNKEMDLRKEIKTYEDFQDYVNDEDLIEGAYKIGVIGWEARKVLKHSKETRHIFDGHPNSSNPTPVKVLSMMEDCIKYVLSQDYPTQIIDIQEYMDNLGSTDFDRNIYAITNALSDLPEKYKVQLVNQIFSAYTTNECSSILRSNIEFIAPILWRVLPKDTMIQLVRRVDQIILKGNASITKFAFSFVEVVNANKYLSINARTYLVKPLIDKLNNNIGAWSTENECVKQLEKYAGYIPNELLYDYVDGLTQTYIGEMGHSAQYSRKDFYADAAALIIPEMFGKFDDASISAFIEVINKNKSLRGTIRHQVKLNRLRMLGNIALERASERFKDKKILELLVDETKEKDFFESIK